MAAVIMNPKDLIEATKKVLEIAPEVYSDGLQPAVQESGKFLARIPKAINAALAGIDI